MDPEIVPEFNAWLEALAGQCRAHGAIALFALTYDGRSACDVVIGAVGADRWEVEILGKASHAGGAPERGISSVMILSLALADVRAKGWFGKIDKNTGQGTCT